LCLNTSRRRHRRSNRKATVLNKSASTESSLIGDLLIQHRAALLQSLTRHACIVRALCKYEYLYNRKGNVYEYVRSMTARHSGDRNASPCRRKLCQELSLDIVFPIACIPRTDPAVGEEIDAELRVSRVYGVWNADFSDRPSDDFKRAFTADCCDLVEGGRPVETVARTNEQPVERNSAMTERRLVPRERESPQRLSLSLSRASPCRAFPACFPGEYRGIHPTCRSRSV